MAGRGRKMKMTLDTSTPASRLLKSAEQNIEEAIVRIKAGESERALIILSAAQNWVRRVAEHLEGT
jgi:hypothetical protein